MPQGHRLARDRARKISKISRLALCLAGRYQEGKERGEEHGRKRSHDPTLRPFNHRCVPLRIGRRGRRLSEPATPQANTSRSVYVKSPMSILSGQPPEGIGGLPTTRCLKRSVKPGACRQEVVGLDVPSFPVFRIKIRDYFGGHTPPERHRALAGFRARHAHGRQSKQIRFLEEGVISQATSPVPPVRRSARRHRAGAPPGEGAARPRSSGRSPSRFPVHGSACLYPYL